MRIPSYMPIGYYKGYCKETKEWIYGWHWIDTPYTCFNEGQKIKHYIRTQINYDWNLTEQKDYLVESESVGQYIGTCDKNRIPLFLGDYIKYKIGGLEYKGYIGFNTRDAFYSILPDNKQPIRFAEAEEVEYLDNRYEKNLDKSHVHTVNLQFKKPKIQFTDILKGVKEYNEFFGTYPKEIYLTKQQYEDFENRTGDTFDTIKSILYSEYSSVLVKGD